MHFLLKERKSGFITWKITNIMVIAFFFSTKAESNVSARHTSITVEAIHRSYKKLTAEILSFALYHFRLCRLFNILCWDPWMLGLRVSNVRSSLKCEIISIQVTIPCTAFLAIPIRQALGLTLENILWIWATGPIRKRVEPTATTLPNV